MKHEKLTVPGAKTMLVRPRLQFRAPGEATETYVVLDGLLALFKHDALGRRHIVALRFPGEVIMPNTGCGIVPMARSEVAVCDHLLDGEADRRNRHSEAIAYQWLARPHDATARVAHLLCEVALRGSYGAEGIPKRLLTQAQIGEITEQTSVNVNRVLAELDRMGLIDRSDCHTIRFPDWDALARLAGFRPDYLE